MKTTTKQQFDPSVFATLHRVGSVWRGVIVRRASNGRAAGGGNPVLLSHREFPADRQSDIQSWLGENQASEIIYILPASSIICRTCTLPNASESQLIPALRLQAESHLLGIAPPHRLGMSVMQAASGETNRIGLVLAWPERNGNTHSSGKDSSAGNLDLTYRLPVTDRRVTFAPDMAGLAALLDSYRPTQPMMWVDRSAGSCAVAMSHANGVTFRAVREDAEETEQWKDSIARALAETALNVGQSGAYVDEVVRLTHERLQSIGEHSGGLFVPDEVITSAASRIDNTPEEASWWDAYGISTGVALARCGKLADLTTLLEDEPIDKPSPIRAVIDVLSRPTTARVAVLICILVLLFGPLVMSSVRLGVLKMQYNRVADRLDEVQQTENKLVVYRQLHNTAWPMSKILADIVSCTPVGIELENINVRQQQTFTLSGRALPTDGLSAPQVVELMREQLRATGIFSDINLNWGQGDAYGNYEFGLNARLHRPFRRFEYPLEQDFSKWTLAERRDGFEPGESRKDRTEAAAARDQAETPPAPREERPATRSEPEPRELVDAEADERRAVVPPPVDRGAFPGGAGSPRDGRGSVGVRPSEDIPEPLSEADIRNMSQSEVSDMLVKISGARRIARRGNDQELIDRLQREFDLLMERMREGVD